MRKRKRITMIGVGVAASLVAFAAALAMADPRRDAGSGAASGELDQSALQAAQALSDAHNGNRAVARLAEIAQREIRSRRPGTDQILIGFNARTEEHLIAGGQQPTEALQILSTLIQGLRGSGGQSTPPEVPSSTSGDEISVVGQDAVVEAGRTVEEASVVWGNLVVRGHVLGDAVAVGGDVRIEPGARVDGDVVSVGGRVDIAQGAWVSGSRTQVGPGTWSRGLPFAADTEASSGGFLHWIKSIFDTIIISIVLGLLAIMTAALFPARVRNVITTLKRRPGMSLLSGLLALVITTTASVLLIITCIGAPVAVALLIVASVAALMGMTGAATLVGEAFPGKMKNSRTATRCLLYGVLIFAGLALLPLGGLLLALALCFSLGATVLSRLGALSPAS